MPGPILRTKDWTYEKRLGVRNVEGKPAVRGVIEGQVTEWWTKDGVPVVYPDHWEGELENMERIPDDIETVNLHVAERSGQ